MRHVSLESGTQAVHVSGYKGQCFKNGLKILLCKEPLRPYLELHLLYWTKVHVQGRKTGPGRPPLLSQATLCFVWLRLLTGSLKSLGKPDMGGDLWFELIWLDSPILCVSSVYHKGVALLKFLFSLNPKWQALSFLKKSTVPRTFHLPHLIHFSLLTAVQSGSLFALEGQLTGTLSIGSFVIWFPLDLTQRVALEIDLKKGRSKSFLIVELFQLSYILDGRKVLHPEWRPRLV